MYQKWIAATNGIIYSAPLSQTIPLLPPPWPDQSTVSEGQLFWIGARNIQPWMNRPGLRHCLLYHMGQFASRMSVNWEYEVRFRDFLKKMKLFYGLFAFIRVCRGQGVVGWGIAYRRSILSACLRFGIGSIRHNLCFRLLSILELKIYNAKRWQIPTYYGCFEIISTPLPWKMKMNESSYLRSG